MISAQDKQAILNGAYAIADNGLQARLLFTAPIDKNRHPYLFLYKPPNTDNYFVQWLDNNFFHYSGSSSNIVGLWKNTSEPFDLERALAGEPLIDLHNNDKCWLYKSHKNGNLITEYEYTHSHLENIEPLEYLQNGLDLSEYFGMWKEPEDQTNIPLFPPKALKEPENAMWYIHFDSGTVKKSAYTKDTFKGPVTKKFALGLYFNSKEKAEAMLHFLKNNKE